MSTLPHAKTIPRRSSARGHANHGWLNSYHTFSFASYQDGNHQLFGALRVLNEDRVAPRTGFPTHEHRDFEIFSYVLQGELTHRDSVRGGVGGGGGKDDFVVMKRGDVQFTTGGTGIAHSEQNENTAQTVHFLQIWALPWAKSLPPIYHTASFSEQSKRAGFVTILSPLKAGKGASREQEKEAIPLIEGTIPIHQDFYMGAGIIGAGRHFEWEVACGRGLLGSRNDGSGDGGRNVYVHLPMTKGGRASVRVNGSSGCVLQEGDGAYVTGVKTGEKLLVESVGEVEAEVVVLDSV